MTLVEQVALTVIFGVTLVSLRSHLKFWPRKLHVSDLVAAWVVVLIHVTTKHLTGYSLVPYLIGSWAIIGVLTAYAYHAWQIDFMWSRFVRHWWRLASIVTFGVYLGVIGYIVVSWWQNR